MTAERKSFLILGVALTLLAPLTAQAQSPAYIMVHYDEVMPAGSEAFEANSAMWVEAFTAAGLGAEHGWDAYSSDFTYAWVSPMPNWAFLDSAEARFAEVGEAVGEEKMAELLSGGAHTTTHYSEVWKSEPELSYMQEGFDPSGMKAANVGVHWVKPSANDEYRAMVKDLVAAVGKVETDINFMAFSVAMGDGSFAFVSWGEDRAALHAGRGMGPVLTEALGPEGAQDIFQRWVDSVVKVDDRDWGVRADLSYAPGAGGEMAEADGEGGE